MNKMESPYEPRQTPRVTPKLKGIPMFSEEQKQLIQKPRGLYPISEVLDELGFGADMLSSYRTVGDFRHENLYNRGQTQ